MVDFSAALRRKYDILQQEADAKSMAAAAGAYLDRTRANVLPGQAAAENFERGARGRQMNVESSLMPDRAESEIGLNRSRAGGIDAEARYRDVMTQRELGMLAPNPYFSEVLGGGATSGGSQVVDSSARFGAPPIGLPSRSSVDMSASSAPRATAPRYSAPSRGPMLVEEVTGARSTGGSRGMMSSRRSMSPTTPITSRTQQTAPAFRGLPAPLSMGSSMSEPPTSFGFQPQQSFGLRLPSTSIGPSSTASRDAFYRSQGIGVQPRGSLMQSALDMYEDNPFRIGLAEF